MKKDRRLEIAEQVSSMIEEHGIEFTMPFSTLAGRPFNVVTGKKYEGLNSFWLGLMGHSHLAGYEQWKSIGYQVQSGAKALKICQPRFGRKDEETGSRPIIGWGAGNVFSPDSVRSIEDGSEWVPPELPTKDDTEVVAEIDSFVTDTGIEVRESSDGGAFYSPAQDYVHMPLRSQFKSTETSSATINYYSTEFHELAHATGHKSRLDRKISNKFGSPDYAYEELVAELSAAMLCAEFKLSPTPRADHAQYVGGWLRALKNDKEFIVKAAKHASDAVQYLLKEVK